MDRPTRFVLLGHARVGSNVLLRSMAMHPEIVVASEVLHYNAAVREECCRGNRRNLLFKDGEDGARFLDERVFAAPGREGIRCCGFKLFYDHARFDASVKTAWDYVRSQREIRIIHLIRRNLLESLISLRIALVTGKWAHRLNSIGIPTGVPPFRIDPADCHEYFNRIVSWENWAASALDDHPLLRIEYESDTCRDFSGTMDRIFGFLGVAPFDAPLMLRKQQTRLPHEQISNYDELKEHFRHTPYEEYFAEGNGRVRSTRAPLSTEPRTAAAAGVRFRVFREDAAASCALLPRFTFWRRSAERPVRFVLLGHEGTGSSAVRRRLEQHPRLAMFREKLPRRAGHGIAACGLTLIYGHAVFHPRAKSPWEDIVRNRDIRIVHLTRRNLLDCLVSREAPFPPDAETCHVHFDRIAAWRRWIDQALAGHPKLTVEYERDLRTDFNGTMERVFGFLGLAVSVATESQMAADNVGARREVANIDSLADYFRHGPYESFFSDVEEELGEQAELLRMGTES